MASVLCKELRDMGLKGDAPLFGHGCIFGAPVYIATQCHQRRKHRKKRINKKWQKRYGYFELNLMPHGEVIFMDNGCLWMTKRTYENLLQEMKQTLKNH